METLTNIIGLILPFVGYLVAYGLTAVVVVFLACVLGLIVQWVAHG